MIGSLEAVAFAFLSASNYGPISIDLRLQGLDPDAHYHIEELDLNRYRSPITSWRCVNDNTCSH